MDMDDPGLGLGLGYKYILIKRLGVLRSKVRIAWIAWIGKFFWNLGSDRIGSEKKKIGDPSGDPLLV